MFSMIQMHSNYQIEQLYIEMRIQSRLSLDALSGLATIVHSDSASYTRYMLPETFNHASKVLANLRCCQNS
jgi:hypothetical protein